MNSKTKQILLRIISLLMLIIALPMMLWSWNFINTASMDYYFYYAGLGCFIAGIIYVFSMVTAIAGLTFASKPNRYLWCRILSYIQLVAGILNIFLLLPYSILTLPPLFILTIAYLFLVGRRNKNNSK
jgi:hypothetical protein